MEEKASVLQWDCNDVFGWASQMVGEHNAVILKRDNVDGLGLLEQTEMSLQEKGMAGFNFSSSLFLTFLFRWTCYCIVLGNKRTPGYSTNSAWHGS